MPTTTMDGLFFLNFRIQYTPKSTANCKSPGAIPSKIFWNSTTVPCISTDKVVESFTYDAVKDHIPNDS